MHARIDHLAYELVVLLNTNPSNALLPNQLSRKDLLLTTWASNVRSWDQTLY